MFDRRIARLLLLLSIGYFALTALMQLYVSGVADLDQAEQLLTSQEIAIGYGHQAPIYHWLSFVTAQILGNNFTTVVLTKVLVLTGLVAGVLQICKELDLSAPRTFLSVAGCCLLPQVIWESQRDLTHSVIATTFAVWLVAVGLKLRRDRHWSNYLLLGVLAGLGCMTKYNFTVLPSALLLAAIFSKQDRAVVFSPKALITLGVGLVILAPHLYWILNHLDEARIGVDKLGESNSPLNGIWALIYASLQFITPLWILYLFAWPGFTAIKKNHSPGLIFVVNAVVAALVILLVIVVLTNASTFKDRWLMPVLIFAPIIFAACASTRRFRVLTAIGFSVALAASFGLIARSHLAFIGLIKPDRSALPYQEHMTQIVLPRPPRYIISDDKLTGGNAKAFYPTATTFVPENYSYQSQLLRSATNSSSVLLICTRNPCGSGADALFAAMGIDSKSVQLTKSLAYFDEAKSLPHRLYWAWIE